MFCNSCQLSHKPQVYLPHPFSGNEAMHSNTYTPTQYISHISVLQVLCTQCTQEFEFCCITYLQNPLIQIWYGLLHFDFCICFFFFLKIKLIATYKAKHETTNRWCWNSCTFSSIKKNHPKTTYMLTFLILPRQHWLCFFFFFGWICADWCRRANSDLITF